MSTDYIERLKAKVSEVKDEIQQLQADQQEYTANPTSLYISEEIDEFAGMPTANKFDERERSIGRVQTSVWEHRQQDKLRMANVKMNNCDLLMKDLGEGAIETTHFLTAIESAQAKLDKACVQQHMVDKTVLALAIELFDRL